MYLRVLNAKLWHFIDLNGLQEPEVEICASMLDALNECVQVCIMKLIFSEFQ